MTIAVGLSGPGWGVLAADSRGGFQGRTLQVQKIQSFGPTALGVWAGIYHQWPATDLLAGLEGVETVYRWLRSRHPDQAPVMLMLTRESEPRVYRAAAEGITTAETGDLVDTVGTLQTLPIANYSEADGRRLALYWLDRLMRVPRLRAVSEFPLHVISVGPSGMVGQIVMSEKDLKDMEVWRP